MPCFANALVNLFYEHDEANSSECFAPTEKKSLCMPLWSRNGQIGF